MNPLFFLLALPAYLAFCNTNVPASSLDSAAAALSHHRVHLHARIRVQHRYQASQSGANGYNDVSGVSPLELNGKDGSTGASNGDELRKREMARLTFFTPGLYASPLLFPVPLIKLQWTVAHVVEGTLKKTL